MLRLARMLCWIYVHFCGCHLANSFISWNINLRGVYSNEFYTYRTMLCWSFGNVSVFQILGIELLSLRYRHIVLTFLAIIRKFWKFINFYNKCSNWLIMLMSYCWEILKNLILYCFFTIWGPLVRQQTNIGNIFSKRMSVKLNKKVKCRNVLYFKFSVIYKKCSLHNCRVYM